MKALKNIWLNTCSNYTSNDQLIGRLWTEIERAHSAKNRFYHNLEHLLYMAEKAVHYEALLTQPDTLMFAIFYHDFIYSATRKDNEVKSAKVAVDKLSEMGVSSDQIDRCYQQIIATKAHEMSADQDTNFLLDFDLAILGDDHEQYMAYTHKVRKEYSIYPDFVYNKGRKKVLQHFISQDRIFKTDSFFQDYEQQARDNLNAELQLLS